MSHAPNPTPTPLPLGHAVLGPNRVVPPRVTLARFHKYDALFRDQFHDPNPQRRFLNYTQLGARFGVSASTAQRDIEAMRDRFELPIDEFRHRGGWGYTKLPPRLAGIWMEEGELLILAASWGALEGRRGSDILRSAVRNYLRV